MSASTLFMFLVLILNKIYVESKERKFNRLREYYISKINKWLFDPNSQTEELYFGKNKIKNYSFQFNLNKPKKEIEFEALGDVIVEILLNITGEIENKLKMMAIKLGIYNYYEKKAKNGSLPIRISAVEKIGYLRLPDARAFLYSILKSNENKDLKARAILALSLVAENMWDLVKTIIVLSEPGFHKSSKFNEFIFINIIQSLRNSGKIDELIKFINYVKNNMSIPFILKRDIIEACGSTNFYEAKKVIIDYFERFKEISLMKIACVRALGRIGGEDACNIIKISLNDADWRVRAVGAKNSNLCSEEIILDLKKCLYDWNYHVRINAAEALLNFGNKGIEVLKIEKESEDAFVRDLSIYMLNLLDINV